MDFSGWEKLSLVDFDDNVTTTLFMAGCNMRCPFCHNSELVLHPNEAPRIPWDEIVAYLMKRKGVLDAVCITGGEPTLMPDLADKIRQIKELGYLVKLDSNGSHPQTLKKLYEQHLVDYFAMDIKNSKEKYGLTCGVPNIDLAPYEESVDFLLHSGCYYEFRTTAIDEFHSEEDFHKIAEWISGAKKYFIQRYNDNGSCITHGLHPVSKAKAAKVIEDIRGNFGMIGIRGYD
ncbi:MAG: anaerobic ribonucleoside-triphosphate reductase activating protein [Bacilli bacterium]|nr:anaerobic ribonucleoside-triphosphate reductase activating protein [Bacilli bacterium]